MSAAFRAIAPTREEETVYDVNEAGLIALEDMVKYTEGEYQVSGVGSKLLFLPKILRGLVSSGAVGVGDVWKWVPVVLKLLNDLGPLVDQIIALIQSAIGAGKRPADFDFETAKALVAMG